MGAYAFISSLIFFLISMVLSFRTWGTKNQVRKMLAYYSWAIFLGLVFSIESLKPLIFFLCLFNMLGLLKYYWFWLWKRESWNWKFTSHTIILFILIGLTYAYHNFGPNFMSHWDFSQFVRGGH